MRISITPKIGLSLRLNPRLPLILISLLIITLVLIIISIAKGEIDIPPLEVIKTVLGLETNNEYTFVIKILRLPRTLTAWLVGVGLAIAGTIIQSITRNPLAAPGIIGINGGAALAAVTLIVLFPNAPIYIIPFGSFAGALLISVSIYAIAWQGGSSPIRLILVGVGFQLIASALTNLIVTFGEIDNVSLALVWLSGSVYSRTWDQVIALIPWLSAFSIITWIMSKELNILNLGDNLAKGLGVEIEWRRGILILSSVALAGASVATAGAVGFVGLISPHVARRLVGCIHQGLLPTAALIGGLLVVSADLLGRLLFAPIEIPCGIITAIIGAPYFLYLMIDKK